MRGATTALNNAKQAITISIHAPREGCDDLTIDDFGYASISIHAPREGCDPGFTDSMKANVLFQSTHPVRGATKSA